jgi:hypothetical protein
MPALLSWVLMFGGIATTVAAAGLSAEVEFEAAIALGGLLATLLGAVGLVLSRVAGDAPAELRPPGATKRVNLPAAPVRGVTPGVATSGPRRPGQGRREAGRSGAGVSSVTPIPTAPRRAASSRTPLLVAAFITGVAWNLTMSEEGGPLDMLAGLIFVATPIAAIVAAATRLLTGRAWAPAVTLVMVGAGVFIGGMAAELFIGLLG